jgi:hypothetical protein
LLPTINRPQTDQGPPSRYCFRLDIRKADRQITQPGSENDSEAAQERPLLCAICSAPITHRREAIAKNGLHEHVFFNPAGIAFEVRCYRRASGCSIQGEPTDEFTWFDGYSWQYALCASCLTHLGWWFTAKDDSFFGLIGDRLIE